MKTVMTFYGLLRRRSGVNSWKAPRDLLRRGSHVEAALQKAESLGGTRRMGRKRMLGLILWSPTSQTPKTISSALPGQVDRPSISAQSSSWSSSSSFSIWTLGIVASRPAQKIIENETTTTRTIQGKRGLPKNAQ